MTILLDIDGVLVTTPAWRPVEAHADGFMNFNERAAANLARILGQTKAAIVLTTTHRIAYPLAEWRAILAARGIEPVAITKVNDLTQLPELPDRATEIKQWVEQHGAEGRYVVIDDDLSINGLPAAIKANCVLTKPLLGLDEEATEKVLAILCCR